MCKFFLFRSFLRRGLFFCGSLAVILLVVLLPLSASADTIHLNPTYGNSTVNYLVTAPVNGDLDINRLESQYNYGGTYNPLILADSNAKQWSLFQASVYWSFGRTLPAGTLLSISCGGWFNKSFVFVG